MNNRKCNLKERIDTFLKVSKQTLQVAADNPNNLSKQDLANLAQSVWDLRHFALELMDGERDETTWYNASIIKEFIDEPLLIAGEPTPISLIEAADKAKREENTDPMRLILNAWVIETSLREVLFDNLKQISLELAA